MQNTFPWLSLSIWIPIFFGVLILGVGRDRAAPLVRMLALVGSLLGLLATLPLYTGFDAGKVGMQFVEDVVWIGRLNAHYRLGIDGISVWFILLTAFINVLVVLAGWEVIEEKVAQYYASFLVLSGLLIGVFKRHRWLVVLRFFEATLIPMYVIIGVWGGPNRVYAAFKFFLYTLAGSLLMLVALIYLYYSAGGTFDLFCLVQAQDSRVRADAAVPCVPGRIRGQGADVARAHLVAGCARGSAYGRIRGAGRDHAQTRCLRFPAFLAAYRPRCSARSGLADHHHLADRDRVHRLRRAGPKRHEEAGRVLVDRTHGVRDVGFFIFSPAGAEGGIVQMISHGFISGAMFLCIGVMYDRMHSRNIADYGGVVNTMPKFAAFMMLFAMANCGLPATSGFVGEFIVILGAIKYNFWIGAAAATTMILGAAYSLWMYKRVIFGESPTATSRRSRTSGHASSPSSGCSRLRCCGWASIPSRSPT